MDDPGKPLDHDADGLVTRARSLLDRYLHDGSVPLLTAADRQLVRAAVLVAPGAPTAYVLSLRSAVAQYEFRATRSLDAADRSVTLAQRALDSGPYSSEDRAILLTGLCSSLVSRFDARADPADARRAVEAGNEAVGLLAEEAPHRAAVLATLGRALLCRHRTTADPRYVEEAVSRFRRAAAGLDHDPYQLALALGGLQQALCDRYALTHRTADLDEAVAAVRRAIGVLPEGHRQQDVLRAQLAGALSLRAERTGGEPDLKEAVDIGRSAVAALPRSSLARMSALSNLSSSLHSLFERTRAAEYLDEAVQCQREALRAMPESSAEYGLQHAVLGHSLLARSARTGDRADADETVRVWERAVAGAPPGHSQRGDFLLGLAVALERRSLLFGDAEDEAAALRAVRAAGSVVRHGQVQRPMVEAALGRLLRQRALRTGSTRDLRRSVAAARRAVRAIPADHPLRAHVALGLADSLTARNRLRAADSLYWEIANSASASSRARAHAAVSAAKLRTTNADWKGALRAYDVFVDQLPLVAWHGLAVGDRVRLLTEFRGAAGLAAAVALIVGDPELALRFLEQCRGTLLAQALESRADLTALENRDPVLAERMRVVRARLDASDEGLAPVDGAEGSPRSAYGRTAAARERQALAAQWDELLRRARCLPGMAGFLRLPPVEELRAAASDGPVVVVNVSLLRCDALVLEPGAGLRVVPLPRLDAPAVASAADGLLNALAASGSSPARAWAAGLALDDVRAMLWRTIAEPVLGALGMHGPPPVGVRPPRVWWCPTGPLSLLPLHAAGTADDILQDRVVPSYTPTVRALAEARSRAPVNDGRLLAVGVPGAEGLAELRHAAVEAERIARQVPGATGLFGEHATRKALLDELPRLTHLHFAGHGAHDPVTGGGALYCHDHRSAGPVTFQDVAAVRSARAEFAFLSACETARGDGTLPDESLHVGGALQLAGFRDVVAAQWSVDDETGARVAQAVYQGMTSPEGGLDPAHSAFALHAAVRALRDGGTAALHWATYTHTGP